ncbi:MAG TPA: glycogen-binding domain-containing protein, partial [Gemmatimonadaceae bacterium]|nr:glycogen-binding domain-containing protein [Gemmatimonadaceae bacterium]
QLAYTAARYSLAANGVLAVTPQDRFTGQSVLTGSLYAPSARRFRWELTGMTSAFGLSGAAPSFAWQGVAREHATWSLGGIFAGVGGGQVAQHGVAGGVRTAQAGGFLRIDPLGRDELSTAIAYTDAEGTIAGVPRTRYRDVVGYWSHRGDWIELSLGTGVRSHLRDGLLESWASGSATVWLARRAALVASAGRALADEPRGVPSVRYFSIGLRFGWHPDRGGEVLRVMQRPDEDVPGRVDIRATADSLRVVIVRQAAAGRVEIVGDFTDWEPVEMAGMPNGEWRIERVITPGPHRMAIRVDGGPWAVPSNLPHVADDFGGEVGIVIVP